MISQRITPCPVLGRLLAGALAVTLLSTLPARAAGGTITFHATVTGKAHESGGFTTSLSSSGDLTNPTLGFIGCGVIKQKSSSLSGTYVLKVQTIMIQLAGLKPTGPGINLEIDHFRPSSSKASYNGMNVTGTFSINGHSYGDGYAERATVKVQGSGTSGTWTNPAATRNYPAKIAHPVPGYAFKASWHCSTLFHQAIK